MSSARPLKLELNNSGAWKTIARFDAGDELACAAAQNGADLLGRLGPKRVSWRIATDEPLPDVLLYWNAENGWVATS
jgi:hypothetical protein